MRGRGWALLKGMVCAGICFASIASAAAADETVMACDIYGNHLSSIPSAPSGFRVASRCPGEPASRPPATGGMAIWPVPNKTVRRGASVRWVVRAPAGLLIESVYIPHMYAAGLNDGGPWHGGFFWAGGSGGVSATSGATTWTSAKNHGRFTWPGGGSRYFGWRIVCASTRCSTSRASVWLSVEELELRVAETQQPSIMPDGQLARATGWIRGTWSLGVSGDSPSGLCQASASLGGQPIRGATFRFSQSLAYWHECGGANGRSPTGDRARAAPVSVDTADPAYPQGRVALGLRGEDAAGRTAAFSKTLFVDNLPVTLSLSGPTEAASTEGTQQIVAAASAGASGVRGIICSLDGGPYVLRPGAHARVAVRGVGVHKLGCDAENNAVNAAGIPATSPIETHTLDIREPALSAISFVTIATHLRCSRTQAGVRCHPKVLQRRTHGRTEYEVSLPRAARVAVKRVPFGASTKVMGWIGTLNGEAVGGQRVKVFTAADDGQHRYTLAARAVTGPDGGWSARLPAGPSRIVEAVYGGSTTVEPVVTPSVRLVVPASITLSIRPHTTHWGGTIQISGKLRGGYVPAGGEAVLLLVGWGTGSTEFMHLLTGNGGAFHTKYKLVRGNGTVTYHFWAATARESDYPYAPANSKKVAVKVS